MMMLKIRKIIEEIMANQNCYFKIPEEITDGNAASKMIAKLIRERCREIMAEELGVNNNSFNKEFYGGLLFLEISHIFRCSEITSDTIWKLIKKGVPVGAVMMVSVVKAHQLYKKILCEQVIQMPESEQQKFFNQLLHRVNHMFLLIIPGQRQSLNNEEVAKLTQGLLSLDCLLVDPFEQICLSIPPGERVLRQLGKDRLKLTKTYSIFNIFFPCVQLSCISSNHLAEIEKEIRADKFVLKILAGKNKFRLLMPGVFKAFTLFCKKEITFEEVAKKIPLDTRMSLMHPLLVDKMKRIISLDSDFSSKNINSILHPLENKQYAKVLRRLCFCGKVELLYAMLVGYADLLDMDVNEKNNVGLSAVDYAHQYFTKHPCQKNAEQCYQLMLKYSKRNILDEGRDCENKAHSNMSCKSSNLM